jgi:glycosidase
LTFFGSTDGVGDQLTMCFDFVGMQRMYLSLARQAAGPLAQALRDRPEPPRDGHWATFVRNHDELTLDKLSDAERAEVFEAFGPDKDMQLYGRGLRRRLPTMLGGDARRIRMVYSLLFSLPGTPVLFYGEEIAMAEDLRAEGRLAVRTPMEWDRVDEFRRDRDSLLHWMKLLIERYRECPELAWGSCTVLDAGEPSVLAHRCDIAGATVVAVHNLADTDVTARLTLAGLDGSRVLTDLLRDGRAEVSASGEVALPLAGYDTRWLRVNRR